MPGFNGLTHVRPHLDEIFAWRLLQLYGQESLPGIENGTLAFWQGNRSDVPHFEELFADNWIALGIGGGPFDEHGVVGTAQKQKTCCATLVAQWLGVDQIPEVRRVLRWVEQNDLHGSGDPLDFPRSINRLWAIYEGNPEDIIAWATTAIDALLEFAPDRGNPLTLQGVLGALYRAYPDNPEFVREWASTATDSLVAETERFHTVTASEFANCATIHPVSGTNLVVVAIESDDELAARYATHLYGERLGATVVRKTTGNTQVLGNKKGGISLERTAALVRLAELDAKGWSGHENYDNIYSEGQMAGADEWYYDGRSQMLLNGSLTAPDVAPTALALHEIVSLVLAGLGPVSEN